MKSGGEHIKIFGNFFKYHFIIVNFCLSFLFLYLVDLGWFWDNLAKCFYRIHILL